MRLEKKLSVPVRTSRRKERKSEEDATRRNRSRRCTFQQPTKVEVPSPCEDSFQLTTCDDAEDLKMEVFEVDAKLERRTTRWWGRSALKGKS